MVKPALALVLIFMCGIVCQAADTEDGSSLLRECQAAVRVLDREKLEPHDSSDATLCMGYISGVLDLRYNVAGR